MPSVPEARDDAPVSEASGDPWVESPEGGLFFVNALLVIPEIVVLVPLALRAALGGLGLVEGSSVYLDTFPRLAAIVLPYAGWLLVVPIWTTLKNLRMELPAAARAALVAFGTSHLGFLGWTAWSWVGG